MRAAAAARAGDASSVVCPDYPPGIESLLGALLFQRQALGDRAVCHRILRRRHGVESEAMTLDELLERAGRAAARLAAAGVAEGDRVILSVSDPHAFLVAFCGAIGIGASAVPLPTVAESGAPRSFAARVQAVSRDCAPRAAVVEAAERFRGVVGESSAGMTVLAPEDLQAGDDPPVRLADRPGAATAFIQYTSGSTGAPKGVVVTHANVMANCGAIRDATAYTRADRMVSWLPLHHDMGLVGGLLTSLYCAAETWLMPPVAFIGRPATWLEAMTRFGATLTVGPTFAYSLCARKIPDKLLAGTDLSTLRLAYIGAEPVDAATLDAFTERFRPYGLSPAAMYPVYGLAEATLAAAFPSPGQEPRRDTVDRRRLAAEGLAVPARPEDADRVTFVSVGRALPRHRVAVVDRDSGEPLPERRVGELVAEGPSITPRYFGEDPSRRRAALRTGDLAYVADGSLYVVDRIKDLVIVAGQNYAPSDIEHAAAEVAGVRRGCVVAFSAAGGAGTEELHLVAEASPDARRPPAEVARDVRRLVLEQIGLAAASVTIVAPGTLERTSSGKVKRRACAEAHRRGAHVPVRGRDLMLYRLRLGARRLAAAIAAFVARRPP